MSLFAELIKLKNEAAELKNMRESLKARQKKKAGESVDELNGIRNF